MNLTERVKNIIKLWNAPRRLLFNFKEIILSDAKIPGLIEKLSK